MSSERPVAIAVQGISKRYRLGERQPYRRLGESIARAVRRPFRREAARRDRQMLWALRDVTFDVREGEILGVIGANGAGKTTLLRVLSKISRPTKGRAFVYGRVGSLLEVGTGFHLELTGRENVFLNGAVLGMTRREIARKYDEIVAFSQLEDSFMETPVKHYSSGMRVRLAFSVAAHLEPEILFIDEVLAVGDAAFQAKCLGKMEEVAGAGRTVLFVSHNMGAVASLCTRAIWMEGGQIKLDGEPGEVIETYLSQGLATDSRWIHPASEDCGEQVRFRWVDAVGSDESPQPSLRFDEPIKIRLEYEVRQPTTFLEIRYRLSDVGGTVIFNSSSLDAGESRREWRPGIYRYTCTIPSQLLRPGHYRIGVTAKSGRATLDVHESVLGFEVTPVGSAIAQRRSGVITPVLPWSLAEVEDEARPA